MASRISWFFNDSPHREPKRKNHRVFSFYWLTLSLRKYDIFQNLFCGLNYHFYCVFGVLERDEGKRPKHCFPGFSFDGNAIILGRFLSGRCLARFIVLSISPRGFSGIYKPCTIQAGPKGPSTWREIVALLIFMAKKVLSVFIDESGDDWNFKNVYLRTLNRKELR